MENRKAAARRRYRQMEQIMTYGILASAGLFLIYLIAAGNGVVWLSAITAILTLVASAAGIVFLYMTGELMRKRSLWMTAALGSIIAVLLVSMLLHYPAPKPFTPDSGTSGSSQQAGDRDAVG